MRNLKILVPAIPAAICLVSCYSGWKPNTIKGLQVAYEAGKAARIVAEQVCRPALQLCIERGLNPCSYLTECQKVRDPVLKSLETLQRTVKSGLHAVELSESETATEKLVEALKIVAEVRAVLSSWGVRL